MGMVISLFVINGFNAARCLWHVINSRYCDHLPTLKVGLGCPSVVAPPFQLGLGGCLRSAGLGQNLLCEWTRLLAWLA